MLLQRTARNFGVPIFFAVFFVATSGPLFAWYFFTSAGGERMQWVFGSSCNPGARPIVVRFDTDTPSSAAYTTAINTVLTQWNNPQGHNINLLVRGSDVSIPVETYAVFLSNPVPNQIWVAYDRDGSILRYLGASSGTILGYGLPFTMDAGRPQDICSGLVVLNDHAIIDSAEFQKTILHELGHVLGFAHNIAGGNGQTIKFASISNGTLTTTAPVNLPIMFPFAVTGSASTLRPDDQAGAYAVYGP